VRTIFTVSRLTVMTCPISRSVILGVVKGLACESIHGVERPRASRRMRLLSGGILTTNVLRRCSHRELPASFLPGMGGRWSLDCA
jgi:hypothetical protein